MAATYAGSLTFETRINTTGINEGTRRTTSAMRETARTGQDSMQRTAESVERATNQLRRQETAIEAQRNTVRGLESQLVELQTRYQRQTEAVGQQENALQALEREYQQLAEIVGPPTAENARRMQQLSRQIETARNRLEGLNTSARTTSSRMESTSGRITVANARLENMQIEANQTRRRIDELNNSANALQAGTGRVNGLAEAFKRLGKVFIGTMIIRKLIQVGDKAVELASDVNEVQNVVDTAFGNMAYKCEEFADTAIEKFGMSKLAAKEFASTYMAMGRGSGLDLDIASDMAIGTAGRTGDIASFYNKSLAEVDTMMKSIYTGETESLKQIGVVMTEVNLQQFAYRQGIQKKISAMTQAEKIQLRYAYVMEQTNLAAGDFEKTSDSWANQTRILSERWKELLSVLGKGLIQVLAPVVKFLNQVVQKLIDFANVFSEITGKLFGKQDKLSLDSGDVDKAAQSENELADATENATEANKKNMAAFDNLNVLSDNKKSKDTGEKLNVDLSLDGDSLKKEEVETSEEVSKFIERLQALLEPFQGISFDNLVNSLGRLKEAFTPFGETLGAGLRWMIENILAPLADWTITMLLPHFLDLLSAAFDVLNAVLGVFKPVFKWLWDNFLEPIAVWTGGAIIQILDWLTEAFEKLAHWIEGHGETCRNILIGIVAAFGLWEGIKFLSYVSDIGKLTGTTGWMALLKAIERVTLEGLSPLCAAIGRNVRALKDMVLAIAKTIKQGILMAAELVKEAAVWVFNTAKTVASTLATKAYTAATKLAAAAGKAFAGVMSALASPVGLAALGIAALALGIASLVKNWDKLSGAERAITILGALASAAIAAAIAVAVFHTAWSIGIAAAAIAGGLALLGLTHAFTSSARNTSNLSSSRSVDPNAFGGSNFRSSPLPKLASGAVIPPNAEFAAILGDQRHGKNIEAPEGLIRQIISEELAKRGGGGNGTANVSLYIDGRELARVIAPYSSGETKRMGVRLINGVT